MAQPDPSRWSDHLPLVLLSLRSTLKADIRWTAADLVYGTSLQVPGDLVSPSNALTFFEPCSYVSIRNLRASTAISSTPPELDTPNFVWVRHDAVRRPLQPPYRVLRRSDKDVVIGCNAKTDTVGIDRVKPAYTDDSDHSSPQYCTLPHTVMPFPPAGDSPPPVRRTRSGRHVHWTTAFGGKDDVGGCTVTANPSLASREKSLFEIATETVGESGSEDLSGDVKRRDACVFISDLSVLFSLVQMNDCRVI
ncbi:hypothetical protein SprV_0401562200 [Sparganum proliferum]